MPGNYPLFAQATNHAKSKPEKIRYSEEFPFSVNAEKKSDKATLP